MTRRPDSQGEEVTVWVLIEYDDNGEFLLAAYATEEAGEAALAKAVEEEARRPRRALEPRRGYALQPVEVKG